MGKGFEHKERPTQAFEAEARRRGYHRIAGVDEAGRGPLAGPVVAAACILPEGASFPGVDDSKRLTSKARLEIVEHLGSRPEILFAVGVIEACQIDLVNILQATFQAMRIAVAALAEPPDFLLVDGPLLPPIPIPARPVIRGDRLSESIALASIIAKVTRDQIMEQYDARFPAYGFRQNKGYGTKRHLAALYQHGPCPIHRLSFAPLRHSSLAGDLSHV